MSPVRKNWQAFKRRHPDFEKARGPDQNVGPAMDKWERQFEEWVNASNTTHRAQVAFRTETDNLLALLRRYEQRVHASDDAKFQTETELKEFGTTVAKLKNDMAAVRTAEVAYLNTIDAAIRIFKTIR
jgi:hypothetical protein